MRNEEAHSATTTTAVRKLVVWLIYQGDEAKPYLNHLRKEFDNVDVRERFVPHVSASNRSSADKSIYDRILGDVESCDVAVAIITPDPRSASAAGNLWLEMGMWLGRKNPSLLLICRHRQATQPQGDPKGPPLAAEIMLPSDLGGKPFELFETAEGLWARVYGFLDAVSKQYFGQTPLPSTGSHMATQKIHDVFTTTKSNNNQWLEPDSYRCHRHRKKGPCEFRQIAIEFAAELLRMGRANHEWSVIANSLMQIGYWSSFVVDNEDLTGQLHHASIPASRRVGLCAISREIGLLFKSAGVLLSGRERTYSQDSWEINRRLAEFIEYRLKVAEELVKAAQIQAILSCDIAPLQGRAHEFVCWAELFKNSCLKSDYYHAGSKAQDAVKIRDELDEWGISYCVYVARVLESLGCCYFDTCREAISSHLPYINDPLVVHSTFRSIMNDLPHNKAASVHLRIWPTHEQRSVIP